MADKFVVNVIWHHAQVVNIVKRFLHEEMVVAVGRAIGFAKISARANAVGSPELFGQYTVESGNQVYYDSNVDEGVITLRQTHNRSKEPNGPTPSDPS